MGAVGLGAFELKKRSREIWIWQRIVSPHMAGLANALGESHRVAYVAEEIMTTDRARQGWTAPTLTNVELHSVGTGREARAVIDTASDDSIHICQGIRGNGVVRLAQEHLRRRNMEQWIVMERINDLGWSGAIKRAEYRRRLVRNRQRVKGVLAIGHGFAEWIVSCGWSNGHVYPFAYFLPRTTVEMSAIGHTSRYRIVFVGQFIRLKRLDMLIEALGKLSTPEVELVVVGSGPLEERLRRRALATLGDRVEWVGRVPIGEVQRHMAQADCLVLPSSHDGWGAVVSESLMVGTPVICSDRCGAAEVARGKRRGGVFRSDDVGELVALIEIEAGRGRQSLRERRQLMSWAACLDAESGGEYLRAIFDHAYGNGPRPSAPWAA